MDKIKKTLKIAAIGFVLGAGATAAIMVSLRPAPNPAAKPYIEPISGAPAVLDNTMRSGDTIRYIIKYTDAGSSALNVPVDSIPEAFAWRHYNWSKTLLYSTDGSLTALLGYRYERVIFQGGVFVRAPQIATRFHFRQSTDYDAGLCVGVTCLSDKILF